MIISVQVAILKGSEWYLEYLGNFLSETFAPISKFRKHLRRVMENHFSVFHSSPNLKYLKSRHAVTDPGVLPIMAKMWRLRKKGALPASGILKGSNFTTETEQIIPVFWLTSLLVMLAVLT